MPSNTRNVKLGVCTVTFDGVDLGYTKGGVEVEVATETHKVMVDQFGNSEINEIIMSRTCRAKVPLAETTLENMARIMPGATLTATNGAKATGTVTFSTAAPVNTDNVVVNGATYTFKTSPNVANPRELAIPASVAAAAAALIAAINADTDPRVSQITASAGSTGVVNITADDFGVTGNLVTLAKTAVTPANITVSGATLTGGVDATVKKIEVTHGIGTSLLDSAKKLVLHPQGLPATDRSEDFVMPLANTPGALTFAYKLEEERIFNVEFSAYPDSVTKVLFIVGDEHAT